MSIAVVFDWLALVALIAVGSMALRRALVLRAQGVSVLAVDYRRPIGQALVDLAAFLCLLLEAYEIVAYAIAIPFHVGPQFLTAVLIEDPSIKAMGTLLLVAALLLYGRSLHDLGASWRMGINRREPAPLVTRGIYGFSRHPIYVAVNLFFAGNFLVFGRAVFLLLALAMAAILHSFMLREERFLSQVYGDAYSDYCRRVSRYLTLGLR